MRAERHLHGWLVACLLLLSGTGAALVAPAPVVLHHHVPTAAPADLVLAAPPAPAEVRRATDEVLSRRAYATDEPSWWQRWAEQARRWVAERLLVLLQATSRADVGWAVLGVATLLAAFVTWRLVRGTRWEQARQVAAVDLERRTAADWDARSRDAEARGELREAVRTAYRGVLAAYAEAGLVEEVAGRTVGEYRRQVAAADPGRAGAFDAASDVVEAVLYADRPPTVDDLATIRRCARIPVGDGA